MTADVPTLEAALAELRAEYPHVEEELLLPLAEAVAYLLEPFEQSSSRPR